MDLAGLGRFADPAVLILSSLAGGDKHGYALVKDIAAFADVRLGPGTLYGALSRLEQRGLIEALPAEDRRRPYRLTRDGAAVLEIRLKGIEGIVRTGLARLRGSKGSPPSTS